MTATIPDGLALDLPDAATEAEIGLLGAMLIEPRCAQACRDQLVPDHLTTPARRALFRAMTAALDADGTIDQALLRGALERDPDAPANAVRALSDALLAATAANWRLYLERVLRSHEDRQEREAREALRGASLEQQQARLDELTELLDRTRRRRAALNVPTPLPELLERALVAFDNGYDRAPRVPTGIRALDYEIGGLPVEGITIVAGRPGMGKSRFATSILSALIQARPGPAFFFSIEMSSDELILSLISRESGVPHAALAPANGQPNLSDEQLSRVSAATGRMARWPLTVVDDATQSPVSMRGHIDRVLAQTGTASPAVVIVDYIQKVSAREADVPRGAPREQAVAWISEELRVISREFRCPVLAVAQLNRGSDARHDQRPRLSDLRESGSLEQDAHLVLGLYRPTYYDESRTDEPDEVLVLKNRGGPLGVARCRFRGGLGWWVDIEAGGWR